MEGGQEGGRGWGWGATGGGDGEEDNKEGETGLQKRGRVRAGKGWEWEAETGRVRPGGGTREGEGAMGRGRLGGGNRKGETWKGAKGRAEERGKRRGDFTDGYDEMPRWTYGMPGWNEVTEFSDFVYPCNAGYPS